MKVSITGTRGIPNKYGGFEQFAQKIALNLSKLDIKVTVYSPSYRKDNNHNYENIEIKKIFFPRFLEPFYHFVYDFLSIRDSIKTNCDIIIVCGYVTSLPTLIMLKKNKSKFLIHTDGLEWKRKKWNKLIKLYIKFAERYVAKNSYKLITDHKIIQEYFKKKYKITPYCIPYGYSEKIEYKPIPENYFLMIARNETENQLKLVIEAFELSSTDIELWIFTNKPLKTKTNKNIKIWLNIYDEEFLNNIRYHAIAYIHAYTVGGTNPSLIEAMKYCKLIIAFNNEFHKEILKDNAIYFSKKDELINIFKNKNIKELSYREIYNKILEENYSWEKITKQYLLVFNTFES